MINIFALFFTSEFQLNYEPIHLLLGAGIGIVVIVILIKKIINRRNRTWTKTVTPSGEGEYKDGNHEGKSCPFKNKTASVNTGLYI